MKVMVQKFGGTSVATPETRRFVYEKMEAALREGWGLVTVISAMGRKGAPYATDSLLSLFSRGEPLPNTREQDMIFACGEIISGAVIANELREHGIRAVFLTGHQAGILSNGVHADATILKIDPVPVMKWLTEGYAVLVAGGQAVTETGDFTSLGRGGSDTTACALGYYLGADEVRIYTDVDGIFTGDPRIIANARPISQLSYAQCRELARLGAKVIHPKAVAFSERGGKNVLSVRSTFSEGTGTFIGDYDSSDNVCVSGLRDKFCVAFPSECVHQAQLALGGEGVGSYILAGNSEVSFCCVEPKDGAALHGLGYAFGSCDVVFVVGLRDPGALQRLLQDEPCLVAEPLLFNKSAAVFVQPGHCDSIMNKLHDSLVLGG